MKHIIVGIALDMAGRQKRRRTDSLPLLDDVFQQSSLTKSRVIESFASLSQVDFQSDTFVDLKAISESAKVCWIFTRFSVKAVMNVAHHILSLPKGFRGGHSKLNLGGSRQFLPGRMQV